MNWFFASGDAPFFFAEQLEQLSFLPSLLNGSINYGISTLSSLWLDYPFRLITLLLFKIGISWFVIDKLWWSLIFIGAIGGSYKLARYIGLQRKFSIVSSLIYSTNTYILMVADGGQLGVSLAYAFFPLIFKLSVEYFEIGASKSRLLLPSIKLGLAWSLFVFLDLRITYVSILALFVYFLILIYKKQFSLHLNALLVPIIVIMINMFWILPSVIYGSNINELLEKNSTLSYLSFFSVADFTHAASLLHPNYPENLFGRVYFFKPEFLLLPVLAFAYFLYKKKSLSMYIFGLLGVLGIFLSKGVQEPFGGFYSLLFNHLPGFVMFRDPTKWYVLVALSFSILIPKTLEAMSLKLASRNNKLFKPPAYKIVIYLSVMLIFVVYWCILSRFVFLGVVRGNTKPATLTQEYIELKDILMQDKKPGRVLWLPQADQFAFSNPIHPLTDAANLFGESSSSGIVTEMSKPNTKNTMIAKSIAYVVVAQDPKQRIYLNNYEYDEDLKNLIINTLNTKDYLTKLETIKNLNVYKMESHRDFFWIDEQKVDAHFQSNKWILKLQKLESTKILSTTLAYDVNWRLRINKDNLRPVKDEFGFIRFNLPVLNETQATLFYLPNETAYYGALISIISLISFLVIGLILFKN